MPKRICCHVNELLADVSWGTGWPYARCNDRYWWSSRLSRHDVYRLDHCHFPTDSELWLQILTLDDCVDHPRQRFTSDSEFTSIRRQASRLATFCEWPDVAYQPFVTTNWCWPQTPAEDDHFWTKIGIPTIRRCIKPILDAQNSANAAGSSKIRNLRWFGDEFLRVSCWDTSSKTIFPLQDQCWPNIQRAMHQYHR